MEKEWRDFKVQFGHIAGAREAFEKACETLFKKMYAPTYVSQMEVSQGDGGIDIFVGEYSIEPIIVVQCKFFLEDFGSSQKQQIKDSFSKAFNNQDYQLREWILCIPRMFTQKDNEWWFEWKEKQNIDIKLINGNELIDLMKEYDVYNRIFKMEDSIRLKELHQALVPKKVKISALSNEKNFLDDIFLSIQREEPIMLLSMTSTPYHNKIAKYYKEKIYKLAIKNYGNKSVFSIYPSTKENIDEAKYFSKLAKQCGFDEVIGDSSEFIEAIEKRLEFQDVFLLISEFENGSDVHRKNLALEFRTLFSNSYEYNFYVVILGRKKLAKLKYEENEAGNSPLNYFYDFLLPTPTISDYKQLEGIEDDISEIYNLTGGHPELMSFCLRRQSEENRELLLNSHYGAKFFQKYSNRKDRLLNFFNQEEFGWFSIWCNDPLLHELFWDNLIVESSNRFKWISPIVPEMGKRYFR